jgi:hypothetical protein
MASVLKVDKLDPQSGTALEIGTSGDTITVPTGAGLTVVDEVKTNKISPATGTAFALGDSGDTFTVPSGATIVNSGTATGFGGGKVLQVVQATYTTQSSQSSTSSGSYTDSGLTAQLTTSAANSKVLCMYSMHGAIQKYTYYTAAGVGTGLFMDLDSAGYVEKVTKTRYWGAWMVTGEEAGSTAGWAMGEVSDFYLSPTQTSSGTVVDFKVQYKLYNTTGQTCIAYAQYYSGASSMVLMEIGA